MKLYKNYGLSLALAALFIFSWIGQGYFQWKEFVSDQEVHNQEPQVNEFFDTFMTSTFENWQSEFLQVFTFIVLATYLIHKDSPQSRDGDDQMRRMLQEINKKLDMKKAKN